MGRMLSRRGARALMILRGHILNPLWLTRKQRRDIREGAAGETVQRYLAAHYLDGVRQVPYGKPAANNDDEKIYSIWLQGEQNAPDLVKACFRSIRKHCRQQLVVMDAEALERELDLPEAITTKFKQGKIQPAHYADICRVELLHKYGGYWMDSTCFATAPIPDDISACDFFVFMVGQSESCQYSYVQNCFIRARKGSYLLECWRRMILDYWCAEDRKIDYFQHQLMFKTIVESVPQAAALFGQMPHIVQKPTHVLWWTIREQPYSPDSFHRAVCGSFFQKTSYRDVTNPVVPGTTMYEMIYGDPQP